MSDNHTPEINSEYVVEKFNDEILLYTESGGQAVYLNDTAHAVFQLCKEDMTVGQIIAFLEDTYPDQREQVRADVNAALKDLELNNVIKFSNAE